MDFKLKGKPMNFQPPRPGFLKLTSWLDALPDGNLYEINEVSAAVGVHEHYITATSCGKLTEYKVLFRGRSLWGNKTTIKAFRKKLGRNEKSGGTKNANNRRGRV